MTAGTGDACDLRLIFSMDLGASPPCHRHLLAFTVTIHWAINPECSRPAGHLSVSSQHTTVLLPLFYCISV